MVRRMCRVLAAWLARWGAERGASREDIEALRKQPVCIDCGGYHLGMCPRVKRVRLDSSGRRLEVEYWERWDRTRVVFPEDMQVEADTGEQRS